MKAHKTEHILVGETAVFELETFDHRSLRTGYVGDRCIIHINGQTRANTIAPWNLPYGYEPVDNYPDTRIGEKHDTRSQS